MRVTRSVAAAACLVLFGGCAFAAGPSATPAPRQAPARKPLTRSDLEAIAKSGQVLCQDWRSGDESCGGVAFMDLAADGTITETVWLLLTDDPDVVIGLRDSVSFDGDALCSVNDSRRTATSVLIEGRPAPASLAAFFSQVVRARLAENDGKRSCETFFHDATGSGLLSTVTTDGARDPKLDSNYRLLDKGAKVQMRSGDDQIIV